MLRCIDRLAVERLAGADLRQAPIFLVIGVLFLLIGIGGDETVETDDRADGAQFGGARAVPRLDFDRRALDLRRLHLAGDGALPDHFVEPRLIGIKKLAHGRRLREKSVGRIASCASCAFLALVGVIARLFRHIFCRRTPCRSRRAPPDRLGRHLHAVGSHIGDQTRGLAADVHPFIELLRDLHGALGGKAEPAKSRLLQSRRGEGRAGVALGRLCLDRSAP